MEEENAPLFVEMNIGEASYKTLLNAKFKGRAFLRTLNQLPWIFPGVVVGLVWEYLYQPNYGPINDMLMRVGVMKVPVAWLSQPTKPAWDSQSGLETGSTAKMRKIAVAASAAPTSGRLKIRVTARCATMRSPRAATGAVGFVGLGTSMGQSPTSPRC